MYRPTNKGLTIWELINQSPATGGEKSKFNKKMSDLGYGLYGYIKFDDYMITAYEHKCFIDWLVDEGIIEKKQEEIFYKRGDRFRGSSGYEAEICIHWADNASKIYASLVYINGPDEHQSYSRIREIKDQNKITVAELKTMDRCGTWKKLTDWEVPVSRNTPLTNAIQKVLEHILDKGSFTSPRHVGSWVKGKVDLWVNHK